MSEQVQTNGFSVPPVPTGATEHSREANQQQAPRVPPAAQQQPGWVQQPANVPAQPTGLTAEEVQAMIAAAAPKPVTPPPAPAADPAEFDFGSDVQNDPVLVSMTTILSRTVPGVDLNRAMGQAIELGNPLLIDIAYLRSVGGANAEQVVELAKGIVGRVNAQTTEATNAVYSIAGNKDSWNAASAAFNQSAPPHMKVVIAALLDSGDKAKITAAAQTVVDFAQQGGLVAKPGTFIASGASQGQAADALDKEGFQAALRKIKPNDRNYEAQRAELFARRQLGKQLGK